MHSHKSSTQEADAGQSQVLGLCGLKRKILPQINKRKTERKCKKGEIVTELVK